MNIYIFKWYCVLATSGDSLEYPHNHFWPLESVMVLWGFIQVPSWNDFTQQFVAINLFNYHIVKPRLRMDEYLLQYITIWIHIIMDLCAHLDFLTKIRSWQKMTKADEFNSPTFGCDQHDLGHGRSPCPPPSIQPTRGARCPQREHHLTQRDSAATHVMDEYPLVI